MVVRKNFRPDPRKNFNQLDVDVLLDVDEAAGVLGLSRHTLKSWRLDGRGPQATILSGRAVRYSVGSIRAWLSTCREAS